MAKPDGLVVVDPGTELEFLHHLPVELMWGVGPVTGARLAEIGVLTIGQLAKTPGWSLERLLGPAAGEKLAALAWNRDPREIETHRRPRSVGAPSVIGRFSDPPCFMLQAESAPASGPGPSLVAP
jgi:DNA polymerase IV